MNQHDRAWVENSLDFAARQYREMLIAVGREGLYPRSLHADGSLKLVSGEDWTQGFFPGALWLLYETTHDAFFEKQALMATSPLEPLKHFTGHHDVGFIIHSSFGQAFRLTGHTEYAVVMADAAVSLMSRFSIGAGVIVSLEPFAGWRCPVLVDTLMNLELLFRVSELTGDITFADTAIRHADTTLHSHCRPDGGCNHLVDFDPENGTVRDIGSHQAFSGDSVWARGHAWAVYGFTMIYRYTGEARFLCQAEKTARYFLGHPHFPADGIPYWDLAAPHIPEEPRDSSAAAILASALIELDVLSGKQGFYRDRAASILRTLVSPEYQALFRQNGCFLLKHGVGNRKEGTEVDVPLIYGDYYFLEALTRFAFGLERDR